MLLTAISQMATARGEEMTEFVTKGRKLILLSNQSIMALLHWKYGPPSPLWRLNRCDLSRFLTVLLLIFCIAWPDEFREVPQSLRLCGSSHTLVWELTSPLG